eukprot:maker-scaffold197_size267318-snap-gene-1.28 protein:Tk09459 transcript:maker-scaffold197_size267318-snap-gene-1.28-mRNA-1 annotation:"---NA---"
MEEDLGSRTTWRLFDTCAKWTPWLPRYISVPEWSLSHAFAEVLIPRLVVATTPRSSAGAHTKVLGGLDEPDGAHIDPNDLANVLFAHLGMEEIRNPLPFYFLLRHFCSQNKNLFKGKRSRGYNNNCGCPCRTYWIKKCAIKLETQCTQKYYKKECKKVPAIKSVKVKATDCQRCVRFQETVIDFSVAKECLPVYDERCKTVYPQICHTEEKCTMIYRTECYQHHYEQKCHQVPGRKCVPLKKCHREPQTQCNTVQRNHCRKVPQPIFKKDPSHKCQEFGPKQQSANCDGIPSQSDFVPTDQFRVKISPVNGVKLLLSGITEEDGRKAVIETLGIDPELAALAQGGGNPASNPAALAALAGSNPNIAALLGSSGAGGNNAALAGLANNPAALAAFANSQGGGGGGNNQAALAALAGQQGGGNAGLGALANNPAALAALANAQGGGGGGGGGTNNQAALAAFAAAQSGSSSSPNSGYGTPSRPSYNNQQNGGGGGQGNNQAALAALAGQQGINQNQLAALAGQQGGGNPNLAALAGQQGISQSQLAALAGQQGGNNNLAALAGQQGFNQNQLAALAGQQGQNIGGLNQNQLAALAGQNGFNQNQLSGLAGNRNPVTGYSPPVNPNNFNLNNLGAIAPGNNYGAAVAPQAGYGVNGASPNLPSNFAGIPGLSNGQLPANLAGIPGLQGANLPTSLQGVNLNNLAGQGGLPTSLASQFGGQAGLPSYANQGAPAPAFPATSTYGVGVPNPAASPNTPSATNPPSNGDGTIASRFPGGVVPQSLAAQIPGLPIGTLPNAPTLPPGGIPPDIAALLPPGFVFPGSSQRLETDPGAAQVPNAQPSPTVIVAQALGHTNERQKKLRILQIKQRRQIRKLQDQISRLTQVASETVEESEEEDMSEFERDREIVTISRRERMLRRHMILLQKQVLRLQEEVRSNKEDDEAEALAAVKTTEPSTLRIEILQCTSSYNSAALLNHCYVANNNGTYDDFHNEYHHNEYHHNEYHHNEYHHNEYHHNEYHHNEYHHNEYHHNEYHHNENHHSEYHHNEYHHNNSLHHD